ncbi:hypothetical protein LCGC14_2106790, partial [marine sediment metagenome]
IHGSQRCQIFHDFITRGKSAHGQAAAYYFSKSDNICLNAQQFLYTTGSQPKTGHYLVKNE